MNKLLYLLFIIFVAFLSCDGRDRVHKSNEEVLIENKLLGSFSENIKYFPEAYNEIETDTILSNGFTIKVKHYTDTNSSIVQESLNNLISTKNVYRNTIADITIIKEGKLIFDKRITKDSFLNIDKLETNQLSELVMNSIYVNEDNYKKSDIVKINFSLGKPNSNYFLHYNMIINTMGDYKLEKEVNI